MLSASLKERKLHLYETLYWKELELKNEISQSISITIGALTIVFAALGYLLENFEFQTNNFDQLIIREYVFIFLFSSSIISATISAYYTARVLYGYNYKMVPGAERLNSHLKDLLKYHQDRSSFYKGWKINKLESLVFDDFTEEMINYYCICSSKNRLNNLKRSGFRVRSHIFLLFSVSMLLASLVVFGVCHVPLPVGLC